MSVKEWNKLKPSQREFVTSTLQDAISSLDDRSAWEPQFGTGLFSVEKSLAPFHAAISALRELSEDKTEEVGDT